MYVAPGKGGLKLSCLIGFLAIALFSTVVNFCGAGCTLSRPIPFKRSSNASVFAAAPMSWRWVVPTIDTSFRSNVPPPYVSPASVKIQPEHASPSRGWAEVLFMPTFINLYLGLMGLTIGTACGSVPIATAAIPFVSIVKPLICCPSTSASRPLISSPRESYNKATNSENTLGHIPSSWLPSCDFITVRWSRYCFQPRKIRNGPCLELADSKT